MQSLHAFWTFLEARPHAQAVMAEWRRVCGDCFDAVAPLLVPTGAEAMRYPPPRNGDPQMRVVRRAHDIVAVCDEGRSERIHLSETDIALHRIDLSRLRAVLCGGLGLKPARTPPGDLPGVLRLGAWAPQASAAFPVVLCAFSEPDALRMALRDFLLDEKKPLFVLTPTDALLDEAVAALAADHKCTLVPAPEALIGDGDRWAATAEWSRFQSAFLERAGITLPGPFQNKRPPKKRASRAADIEALKKVLVDRIRAAAVVAESALDNEQAIDLPPRPTKATLGTLAGLKPHTVTRCFQDSDELRRLYEMLRSPDDVLRFGKVRRRG